MSGLRSAVLFMLCASVLLATGIAAGGGQYPGNHAGLLLYVKLILFLAPVAAVAWRGLRDIALRQTVVSVVHDNGLMILFCLSIALSLPLADYPVFSSGRYAYTLLGFASVLCLACLYRDTTDATYVAHVSLFGWLVIVYLAVLVCFGTYPDVRSNVQASGLVHPNMLSSLCAQIMIVVACAAVSSRTKTWRRRALVTCFLLAIVALQSRGVWIGLIVSFVACAAYMALAERSARAALLLCAMILTAFMIALVVCLNTAFAITLLGYVSRGQSLDDLLSLTNRVVIWQQLFDNMTWKQALVGHGYAVMSPAISLDFGSGQVYGAHNGYLSLYLGTGLISTLLFFVAWFNAFRGLSHANASTRATVLASAVLFFTHSLSAEEFGLHITPTFVLLFLNTERIRFSKRTCPSV